MVYLIIHAREHIIMSCKEHSRRHLQNGEREGERDHRERERERDHRERERERERNG